MKAEWSTLILPSGTAVIDSKGEQVVLCPTEDEALEYIREKEGCDRNED